MSVPEERALVLAALELIRQYLNGSSLKGSDPPFYDRVKDFCAATINEYRDKDKGDTAGG